MKSKASLWQARWQINQAEGLAIHDSGLRVRLQDNGQGSAENPGEIAEALIKENLDGHAAIGATEERRERLLRGRDFFQSLEVAVRRDIERPSGGDPAPRTGGIDPEFELHEGLLGGGAAPGCCAS